MKKVFKFICFLVAGLVSWFAPLQTSALEAQGICCATCVMKKEEDKVQNTNRFNAVQRTQIYAHIWRPLKIKFLSYFKSLKF